MTDLVVIGADKFALEMARYVGEVTTPDGAPAYTVTQFLVVAGETARAPAEKCVALADFEIRPATRVVLAVSDPARRRELIDHVVVKYGLVADNIVHPTSVVDPAVFHGVGNVVGPHCYVGVNVIVGDFNVVNYHCTIGHHSTIGSNNFVAPNFTCGNTVAVGDDNFFGLSCTVAPEVTVGNNCRFQAGVSLFDDARSGHSYLVPNRVKSIKSL